MRRLSLLLIIAVLCSCDKDPAELTGELPKSEAWWDHHVFYQIFVRSFYDSNGDGIGDLRGIIQKLDYLNDGNPETTTDLGVTGICLMPIHPSGSYHGYDVTDFMSINPEYGSISDFSQLVSEAHARGIKVIIDVVANNTSDRHSWFTGAAANVRSDKRPYYVWAGAARDSRWTAKSGQFYYARFGSTMPDLNYLSERVGGEMANVAKFWDEQMHVDGYRMNGIPYLIEEGTNIENTPGTLSWLRTFWLNQKMRNPSLMLVGEVGFPTSDVIPYADHRTDYCLEFDMASAITAAVASGDPLPLKLKISEVISGYPERQYGVFLSTHDQNRSIESLSLNNEKAKIAAAIMLTLPGVPYLYYGEEVGMRGVKPDEDIRRPMQWTAAPNAGFTMGSPWRDVNDDFAVSNVATLQEDPNSIWNHYRKLIRIRNNQLALRQGIYLPVDATAPQILSYMILNGNDAIIAVHNLSGSAAPVVVSVATPMWAGTYKATDLLTDTVLGTVTVSAGGKLESINLGALAGNTSRVIRLTE